MVKERDSIFKYFYFFKLACIPLQTKYNQIKCDTPHPVERIFTSGKFCSVIFCLYCMHFLYQRVEFCVKKKGFVVYIKLFVSEFTYILQGFVPTEPS